MIGKSPEMPCDQSPAGASTAQDGLGRGTQRRRGIEQMPRQSLKQARLGPIDPEVMKLHLRLGPGERRGTIECAYVVRLVDEVDNVRARLGYHGPKCNPNRRARREAHTAPQGEDGIEDRSGGSGKQPTVDHGGRAADVATATEETAPVGFELGLAYAVTLSHRMMCGPDLRLGRASDGDA